MRIIKTETEAFKFNELTDAAREKALVKLWDINVNFEWWDFTIDDAKNIGLIIDEFDLDRGAYCRGKFVDGATECADKIIKEHGDTCETYTTAAFLKERDNVVDTAERDENGDVNEWELDKRLDAVEAEFLHDILEDYRIILQKEYEYLTSEAAILETIEANDYEFTKDGRII